jgi:hypothetical protein
MQTAKRDSPGALHFPLSTILGFVTFSVVAMASGVLVVVDVAVVEGASPREGGDVADLVRAVANLAIMRGGGNGVLTWHRSVLAVVDVAVLRGLCHERAVTWQIWCEQ